MSQENVEIVRKAVEAFEQSGLDEALRFYDPEVTWEEARDEPEAESFQGHDGVRALAKKWLVAFDDLHIEPEEFIDAGEVVIMPSRFRGRQRSSGLGITDIATWVFSVRGGRIYQVREYRHKTEALEAVGLSEQDAHADS
jgi:ketosteroid isomerase-like protein